MAAHRRFDWHTRIKDVEREFAVARAAIDGLLEAVERGDATLPPNTKTRDVNKTSENLEGTYLIRMFAEFESGLRSFWTTQRDSVPQTRDLIDAIASRRSVPDDVRNAVHDIRGYRNRLIHESDTDQQAIRLIEARRSLQTYFSRLPERW